MRHWIGLVLAIALAAALFFGAAWGMTRLAARPADGRRRPAARHPDRRTEDLTPGHRAAGAGAPGLDRALRPEQHPGGQAYPAEERALRGWLSHAAGQRRGGPARRRDDLPHVRAVPLAAARRPRSRRRGRGLRR